MRVDGSAALRRGGTTCLPARQASQVFQQRNQIATFWKTSRLPIVRKPRFSTLRIISSKGDGSPCLVIADEDLTLDFEAGTPGTSNHGAGVRCFISAHEKNLPNRFVSQDEELGADADEKRRRGGPALRFGRDTVRCSKWRGENE